VKTGVFTQLGNVSSYVLGLAHHGGALEGTTLATPAGGTTPSYLTIDRVTGASAVDIPDQAKVASEVGLALADDDTIYVLGGDGVYTVARPSGAQTRVVTFKYPLLGRGDLAFMNGHLYATTHIDTHPDSIDDLTEVDLAHGTTRTIGTIGYGCVFGMANVGGDLYAATCGGQILHLNTTTGAGNVIATEPGVEFVDGAGR
jgi:hypothetical protein